MTKKKGLPKGFTCVCGEEHKFSGYVYAHWTIELVFTCPKCCAEYWVRGGVATHEEGTGKKVKT